MSDDGVGRVREALARAGHPDTVVIYPAGTRTAADAAAAIGCEVAQIAKSIVFRARFATGDRAAVVIMSGANRVDPARADAAFVRQATGFVIGGVAPVGHLAPPLMLLDEDLMRLDPVWAAAGSPQHVFCTSAAELMRMTGAAVDVVAEDRPRAARGTGGVPGGDAASTVARGAVRQAVGRGAGPPAATAPGRVPSAC